jgi:hypothetical protein
VVAWSAGWLVSFNSIVELPSEGRNVNALQVTDI